MNSVFLPPRQAPLPWTERVLRAIAASLGAGFIGVVIAYAAYGWWLGL